MKPALGTLYLVPTPLDFGCADPAGGPAALSLTLPLATLQSAARLTHWLTENAKSTRAFLKRVDSVSALALPLQGQRIVELPSWMQKGGDPQAAAAGRELEALLEPTRHGHDIGLVSEAGLPGVADPGAALVCAAHRLGLRVQPLVGPVSLMLALAASGLNGQQFAFVGYLPRQGPARRQRILELEAHALRSGQTQICIETPYRNRALLQALRANLQPGTRLALATGLTLAQQHIVSARVADWPQSGDDALLDLPTVFLWGR